MKKNCWIPLVISVFLGFLSAQIVYSTYKKNLENSEYNAYLIQVASYNNKESIDPVFLDNTNFLIIKEDNIYNIYAGITTDLMNAHKIKNIYTKKDIDIEIKPTVIDNIEFISNLEQYDILMEEVDEDENVLSINDVILSSYEEMVLGK